MWPEERSAGGRRGTLQMRLLLPPRIAGILLKGRDDGEFGNALDTSDEVGLGVRITLWRHCFKSSVFGWKPSYWML